MTLNQAKKARLLRVGSMADLLNAFRGYGRVLEAREAHDHKARTSTFNVLFDIHGKKIRCMRRADGVMFVNCAGETALVGQSVPAIRKAVALALRK